MSKKLLIAVSALFLFTIINSVVLVTLYRQGKKTVVIDVIRVFNEFKLKKDLEGRVAAKLEYYSARVDSMKAVYNVLVKNKATDQALAAVAGDIDTLQARARQAYVISDKNINEQVWTRLNTLITEFGTKQDYVLMIGANGMGTVLFNQKELDKTEELIKFINEKYEPAH